MKVRIKGNSLRYRLTKTDVCTLAATGAIEEYTRFGEQTLAYTLKTQMTGSLSAVFENNEITVFINEAMVTEWMGTEKVGFEYTNDGLYILLEKDFTCLDNVAEDQSDNYPNPLAKLV